MKPLPKYYWDASVFIALLINEHRSPGEIEGARDVALAADSGEVILATSQMTVAEILDPTGIGAPAAFDALFKRANYQLLQANSAVYAETQRLRMAIPKLKTPDATHLASAIVYRCDELHAFDKDDLLKLSGKEVVRGLKIHRPSLPQPSLGFGV
jgi:predicted nucleic acid-binding protein